MKVRELKNFLELQLDESQVTKTLNGYSHWIAAIHKAGEYVTSNPKDTQSLKRLEDLKVVELKEVKGQLVATLTKSGRELYQDFYGHGYY